MTKRSLYLTALLLIAAQHLGAHICYAKDERPNIIFILTDDHRADLLGCYGNEIIETPSLDQLSRDGALFENAFVTSAICTPSRASYFLGQYERRHGINFNSGTAMAPEAWANSYPVRLREAGYFTGYVGKNHVPIGPQGYESGIIEESFDYWYAGHGHLRFYPKDHHEIFLHASSDTQIEIVEEGALSFLGNTESFIDGAKSFLSQRDTEKPFCLSVAFNLPHGAGTSTMRMLRTDDALYRTHYRDRIKALPLPANYRARDEIDLPRIPADVHYVQFRQTGYDYVDQPDTLRERMVRQYQTVTGIDRFLGSLRSELEQQGLDDNTIIVVASDHGIMLGEFGLGGKALNYEPCLRIPMIVMDPRLPRSERGLRLKHLVMSIDIAPTLLEWAGADIPETIQGRSLISILKDNSAEWRDAAFAENLWSTIFGNPRCESVRTARWKYIRYFANDRTLYEGIAMKDAYRVIPGQGAAYERWLTSSIEGEEPDYEELFDLESDPEETKNLAANPSYSDVLEEMRDQCRRLVREAKGDVEARPLTLPLPKGIDTK